MYFLSLHDFLFLTITISMSIKEQQEYRAIQYAEALRYMENASASLQKVWA
jgi:hypothetical protein